MTSNKNRQLLIMEPSLSGHRGPYMSWMARGIADRGLRVTLATLPGSLSHPSLNEIREHATRNKVLLDVVTPHGSAAIYVSRGNSSVVANQFIYWLLLKSWYSELSMRESFDVVFLPSVDTCLYSIALLGSPFGKCPWVGLTMRPSFHYRDMGIMAPRSSFALAKRALFLRVLHKPHLKSLLTLDESLLLYLKKRGLGEGKVALLPEPSESYDMPPSPLAKQRLGIKSERLLILLYGTITRRKGVRELLRALAHPLFPDNVDVYFAGKVYPDVQELLGEPQVKVLQASGRLRVDNRFIEASEVSTLFAAADAVWLGYQGHYGPSGALIQAAAAGKPVVACQDGVIGWMTRRYQLGVIVKPTDTTSVIDGIQDLMSGEEETAEARNPVPFGTFSMDKAIDVLEAALVGLPELCGAEDEPDATTERRVS